MPENDEQPGILVRMAAHSRLSSLHDGEAKALAVEYQLVTSQTSCVLVKQRDAHDKAEEIPALRKVPHRLAAGYGGMGTVYCCKSAPVTSDFCDYMPDSSIEATKELVLLRKQIDTTDFSDQVVSGLNRSHSPVTSR